MKKLPSLLGFARKAAGFTMIELLIVITILGILAVAVLSAINPIEQINRGRDTSSKSDAEQLLGAMERFNAFQTYFPWMSEAGDEDGETLIDTLTQVGIADGVFEDGTPCNILYKLGALDDAGETPDGCTIGSNELKASFIDRIGNLPENRALYVYNQGRNGDNTYVCFEPQSSAFMTEARNRCYDADGELRTQPTDIDDTTWDIICANEVDNAAGSPDIPMICLP